LLTPSLSQLLAYLSSTNFIKNIPFHLIPPSFAASHVQLPSVASSAQTGDLEQFLVQSEPFLGADERLAYCEDAIPFSVPSDSEGEEESELVLLSCDPNRKRWNTVMGPLADPHGSQGAFWVVDPAPVSGGEPEARKVRFEWPAFASGETPFHPLGIEVVEPSVEGGERRLLAVNHGPKESTIEIFSLSSSSSPLDVPAVHLHTLTHTLFTGAPNSIAVLPSPSSHVLRFFLTHDHKFTRRTSSIWGKLANFIETVGALPLSRVDYVEVTLLSANSEGAGVTIKVETVADKIAFANGLALSADEKTLVVASTTRRELHFYSVFDPLASPPSPNLTRTVKVPMLVDNLSLLPSSPSSGESFTVLAAGHPSYPAILSAAHSLHISLHLPPSIAKILGVSHWPGLDFDSTKQRGMSWAVSVEHPAPVKGDEAEDPQMGSERRVGRKEKVEWRTVFQSHGRTEEGGFGGSTTAVVGSSGAEGGAKWLVVAGLYEEGVKVVGEKRA
jgi:hypothetical protein